MTPVNTSAFKTVNGFGLVKTASSQLVVSVIKPRSPGTYYKFLLSHPNLAEKPISLALKIVYSESVGV